MSVGQCYAQVQRSDPTIGAGPGALVSTRPNSFQGAPHVSTTPLKIAVTGAAGQIAYSLLFRLASGSLLGADRPIELRLLEIEPALKALEGVVMELDDCAFPLLAGVQIGADANKIFDGVNLALLVGARPRGPGMERSDLLEANGAIFTAQGKALNSVAADDVRIGVTGNPANTNALIAMTNAPDIPRERFSALTRLDHNRAISQLARKTGAEVTEIKKITIWGNHSATQYPDIFHAEINGKNAAEVVNDQSWIENDFIPTVAKRGAAIIDARGASSAASAASATIDAARDWLLGSPDGDWVSMAVLSDGSYGVPEGLISSFPVTTKGGNWTIVSGLEIDDFSRGRIDKSTAALADEREAEEIFEAHIGGKLSVQLRSPLDTQRALSIAYTPGVAQVSRAIAADHTLAARYTWANRLVAVVSDGSAVLGLGDIGPEASLPVMEGKCALFKAYGGLNAIPIVLDTKDPDEIVETLVRLRPTFGAVNLEDISAPRCFEIERRVIEALDCPVMHDDQHGTAIVVLAALNGAAKVQGRAVAGLRVVISGAGAAGVACANILLEAGVED